MTIPANLVPRLVSEHSIAGPWGVARYNWCNRLVGDLGWAWYAETIMRPVYYAGCRRFLLRCPFGVQRKGEGPIILNYDVVDRAPPAMLDGFVDAMRAFPDCELIFYTGCPSASRPNLWSKLIRNIQPALDAGMSLAFDVIVEEPKGGPAWDLVEWLKDGGTRVYVEAMPLLGKPWWMENHWITPWQSYQNWMNPTVHTWSNYGTPEQAQLAKDYENIVWLDGEAPGKHDWPGILAHVNQGKTVCTGLYTALVEREGA